MIIVLADGNDRYRLEDAATGEPVGWVSRRPDLVGGRFAIELVLPSYCSEGAALAAAQLAESAVRRHLPPPPPALRPARATAARSAPGVPDDAA